MGADLGITIPGFWILVCGLILSLGVGLFTCHRYRICSRSNGNFGEDNSNCCDDNRRRMAHTPILNLAREIGIDPLHCDQRPLNVDVNTELRVPTHVLGIAKDDLVWMVPVACIEKILWV